MTGWINLTDEQRKATIDQAEQISGIGAKAIEKDWWVTFILKSLFHSILAPYMVFKGGTSLSKCWKLIERFSEDVDIALAPEAFDMEYSECPSKSYVERLKKKGCKFTSNELKRELEKQVAVLGMPDGIITIAAAPMLQKFPDTDPQILYVKYRSLYEANLYVADEVKIEVSVRSLLSPYTNSPIQSLLNEINPNTVYGESPFLIKVVEPRKTFLEKIFLLHEEFGKPDKAKIRAERMSRHLYDLVNIMQTDYAKEALDDTMLYNQLLQHRKYYSHISWVDYKSMDHATLSFIPPEEVLEIYRMDYQTMQEQMIYGESIPFDSLIEQLKLLQKKFRMK